MLLGLLMDRMDAPGWLWGMFLAVAGMWLLANLVDLLTAKDVEL